MSIEEAADWKARKRAGTVRSGPRVLVRSDRGAAALHVMAPSREPVEVYPGRVDFLGSGAFDVSVTVAVVDQGDNAAPVVDVSEVAFRPRVGGGPLTARGIQSVNVGSLMRQAVDALSEATDPSTGRRVSATAGPGVRRVMAPTSSTAKRGRPGYSDEELRFFADAYRAAPARGRYEAIRRAYDRDRRWRTEAGSLAPDALRYRARVARERGLLEPA